MEAPVNVLKRDKAEVRAEAEALLARVGLAEKLDSFPNFSATARHIEPFSMAWSFSFNRLRRRPFDPLMSEQLPKR
jgi:ABC-type histidine transport system ATPase subunit